MLEADRLRIAMLLTEKLSVRRIAPTDDGYSGTDGHYEYRIEGIAEAADALAREHDLARRLVESAERHLQMAALLHGCSEEQARHKSLEHIAIAAGEISAAIALLRDGKVPAELMETAG